MGVAAHLGIDLREYDARIRTFIPGYEAMLEMAAGALRTTVRGRAPLVVDLGIGTGALAAACLQRVPRARIVGIDEDEGMLAAARARLGRRLQTVVLDSFERATIPLCDAVVASLALHHIPTSARRLRLFRRLHAALGRGGVLIVADCYLAADPRLRRTSRADWLSHLTHTYSPAAARGLLRAWAREDHYVTLNDELTLLRRGGFDVDVTGRLGAFAVLAAVR